MQVDPSAFRTSLRAEPSELSRLRRMLMRWLRATQASAQEIYDITIACGEACANAVEHAYGPRGGAFELEACRVGDDAVVMVRDAGRWRAPRGRYRGRGISIMETSMDTVHYRRTDRGTEVVLRRRIGEVHAAG